MKKIILFLILSITAFAWQKQNLIDEFGDRISSYVISEQSTNGDCILSVGKSKLEVYEGSGPSVIAFFYFDNADFGDGKTNVKIKIKTKNGIEELNGYATKNFVFTDNNIETMRLLRILRDNNVIKVAIGNIRLKFNAIGFSKLYKQSFWQGFDDSLQVTMPPKGEKIISIVEGQDKIEKQDDIWYYSTWLK